MQFQSIIYDLRNRTIRTYRNRINAKRSKPLCHSVMNERMRQLLRRYLCIAAAGILYVLFVWRTGIGIPCLIRSTTGWLCPGCGITTMAVRLIQGRYLEAYYCNQGLVWMVPALLYLWIRYIRSMVREGRYQARTGDQVITWLVIVWLVLWTLIRNL